MSSPPPESGYVVPPRLWRWAGTRRGVAVVLWLVALGTATHHLWHGRTWFGNRAAMPPGLHRPDGNNGHAQIDFGGQWVMGRMVALGHGRELYHRQRQWEVVRRAFPPEREPPAVAAELFLPKHARTTFKPDEDVRHDADWMMFWFMGADPPQWSALGGAVALPFGDLSGHPLNAIVFQAAGSSTVTPELEAALKKPAVGGPLYPPVQGFFYAPLALGDHPQQAYAVVQWLLVGCAFLAALGVRVLTRGRVWCSAAAVVILMYPGARTSIDLAQNPILSLVILVWGWVLAARGREWLGGMVWGLFVFKPVWGMAFFLVPLLTRRWRFCVAMVLTGAAIAAATLPFVGLQTWFDWLAVGKEAAALYDVNKNWVHLSRDLHGIPNRILVNFDLPESERRNPLARTIGWALWGSVFVTTVAVYLKRGNRRAATGLGAAFLLLGAYHTCYRFMYYDVLLSLLGVAALFADPRRFFAPRPLSIAPAEPGEGRELPRATEQGASRMTGYVNSFPLTVLFLLILVDSTLTGLKVEATVGVGFFARPTPSGTTTALATPRLKGDTSQDYPLDAALVFALWAWCGWRLWRDGDDPPDGQST